MVVERKFGGDFFKRALKESGFDIDDFRYIYFRQDPENDGQIRKELSCLSELSEYPSFDSRSYLYEDVVNGIGDRFHVLIVPKDCPILGLGIEKRMGGEPDETMTYLVEVQRSFGVQRLLTWPVYTECDEKAERIARKVVSKFGSWPKKKISLSAKLTTPDAFCKQAENLIDQGYHLPAAVLWIRDLRSRAIERDTFIEKTSRSLATTG